MKKIIYIILAVVLAISCFVGCATVSAKDRREVEIKKVIDEAVSSANQQINLLGLDCYNAYPSEFDSVLSIGLDGVPALLDYLSPDSKATDREKNIAGSMILHLLSSPKLEEYSNKSDAKDINDTYDAVCDYLKECEQEIDQILSGSMDDVDKATAIKEYGLLGVARCIDYPDQTPFSDLKEEYIDSLPNSVSKDKWIENQMADYSVYKEFVNE